MRKYIQAYTENITGQTPVWRAILRQEDNTKIICEIFQTLISELFISVLTVSSDH
jgi:hypothetical protein